jgi:hypothetical protein
MIDKSKADPKARPTATDTPDPAGPKPDTELSDAALDKVVGGSTNLSSSRSNIY